MKPLFVIVAQRARLRVCVHPRCITLMGFLAGQIKCVIAFDLFLLDIHRKRIFVIIDRIHSNMSLGEEHNVLR